jgi:glycosyltransferase involved in cell wall biosynthesis
MSLSRISIVIPTYKSAEWVEATLESIVRQTFPLDRLEIIVVDDASPDDSAAVAERFLSKQSVESRVVRHEKNRGAPANRNSGWKLASGDWIQLLDADDILAPHKLALQASVAESAPEDVAVVYSNWQYFENVDGNWQPTGELHAPFIDDDPIVSILNELDYGYVGPTIIRRAFLEKVGGFEEKPNIGEDCDLMLRMGMAGGTFRQARSETAAFLYRQWPNSLWRNYIKNKVAMRNTLLTFRRVEEFLRMRAPNGELSGRAKEGLMIRYSRWAEFFAEHDPATCTELEGWLTGLGIPRPRGLGQGLELLSALVGFQNAIKARTTYRKLRGESP